MPKEVELPLMSLLPNDRKTQEWNMLYGYARLPYVNYRPALLSARRPVFDKEKGELKVEIQNFGLSASEPAEVEVICGGHSLGG